MEGYIKRVLEAAALKGIEPAEVYMAGRDSFRAMCQKGVISNYSVSATHGLCLRGIYQGRMGYASTEAFDEESIPWLVERVMESARLNEDTEQAEIYPGDGEYPVMDNYAPELDRVSAADRLALIREAEQALLKKDPRIAAAGRDMISVTSVETRIENSRGLKLSHRDNAAVAFLSALAKEGDRAATGYGFLVSRDFKDLKADELADRAAGRALFMLGAQPVKSGTYRCIFLNEAMADMLGVFSAVFSAENAQKNLSLLSGREGEKIASDAVTLMDDPLLNGGFASRPFDDEGVRCVTKKIIDHGVLTTLLYNLSSARKAGRGSTGNGLKASYSAPVRVAPTNFFFAPGESTLEELMRDMGDGIVVTEVSGLHAGANAVSGDFSLIAEGYTVVDGKKGQPVEQVTVAGNFYTLLRNIRAVGCDLIFPGSGIGSPSVDIGSIAFAGK